MELFSTNTNFIIYIRSRQNANNILNALIKNYNLKMSGQDKDFKF